MCEIKLLKDALRQPQYTAEWQCNWSEGGLYWVPVSSNGAGDMRFVVDWDQPYLSVPNKMEYDTAALVGPGWADDGENDARCYDFEPVDLADEQQTKQLIDRVVDLLGAIKVAPPAP